MRNSSRATRRRQRTRYYLQVEGRDSTRHYMKFTSPSFRLFNEWSYKRAPPPPSLRLHHPPLRPSPSAFPSTLPHPPFALHLHLSPPPPSFSSPPLMFRPMQPSFHFPFASPTLLSPSPKATYRPPNPWQDTLSTQKRHREIKNKMWDGKNISFFSKTRILSGPDA